MLARFIWASSALLACLFTAGASAQTAYIWEHEDKWTKQTGDAAARLEEAGFEVKPLPRDESPWLLKGLIFIGSFASEDPDYQGYMAEYADDLYNFVDKGNVLLQMTQADQTEAAPPFLPSTHAAKRDDTDGSSVVVLAADNPLLKGVPVKEGSLELAGARAVWEAFREQDGFQVILSIDEGFQHPALMEGAYGQGRLLLCSIPWDKAAGTGSHAVEDSLRLAFAKPFCANLRQHTTNVMNRRTQHLAVTPATSVRFTTEGWKLAVLPDTQVYSLRTPGLYDVQTTWIARNAQRYNIEYVLHLGDIVNNNTPMEWERAANAMSILDGVVPYALAPGNHDYGPSGDASTRDTLMNDYFDYYKCAEWPTFGGAMEPGKLDNTYHLFEAGNRKWIVIALEWGPRDSTVAWADSVMSRHADRTGILITHAYMNNNDRRYDHTDSEYPQHYNPHHYATPGGVNDGEELWQKLVRRHRFAFAINGHVLGDGTGYKASTTDVGNTCHQMLANYQMRELGGESYLRVLEFLPDGQTVRVRSYSPLYDRFMFEADQNFTVMLE